MAVAFAAEIAGLEGICLLSADSEGSDGPTDAAGGLVDSYTIVLAKEKHISLRQSLREHSTYDALGQLGARITTGNTGTSLCNLYLLYVF
jgi:glycerate-2-kinase